MISRTVWRAGLGVVLLAGVVLAQSARPVRIVYEAPPACPDAPAFVAQVRARSPRAIVSADAESVARVTIEPRDRGFLGELVVGDTRRHVEGASCNDVFAALALITALAIDPTARGSADAEASASADAGTGTDAEAAARAEADAGAGAKADAGADAEGEAEAEAETRARSSAERPWRWSIGAHAGLTSGVAPDALLSIPAFLDVASTRRDLLAPAFRLRFERAVSGVTSISAGSADFTWTAGSLDVCPVAWSSGRARLWPCVRVEGGVLDAFGVGVSPARSDTRIWLSVAAIARARLSLAGPLFLEIEGGATLPLVRDRFFVEPDATIHRAPIIAASGAAGAGVSFW